MHLGDTHSRWWPNGPWGPQRVEDPQSHLWSLSADTKLLDEPWSYASYVRLVCLLCWRGVLPEVPLNLSSSVPSASSALCSMSKACSKIYILLQAMVTLNYHEVMNFGPWTLTMSGSRQVVPWLSASTTVTSLLVFQFKVEPCKGTDPSVTCSL